MEPILLAIMADLPVGDTKGSASLSPTSRKLFGLETEGFTSPAVGLRGAVVGVVWPGSEPPLLLASLSPCSSSCSIRLLPLVLPYPALVLVLVLGQAERLQSTLPAVAWVSSFWRPAEVVVAVSAGLKAGLGHAPGPSAVPKKGVATQTSVSPSSPTASEEDAVERREEKDEEEEYEEEEGEEEEEEGEVDVVENEG